MKRRYKTKEQIERQIDKANKRLEGLAVDLSTLQNIRRKTTDQWKAEFYEKELCKMERSIQRLRSIRLPKLKNKLAEFQTMVIPGILEDNTVPV